MLDTTFELTGEDGVRRVYTMPEDNTNIFEVLERPSTL